MGMGLRYGRSQGMEGSTGNLREYAIDAANTNPIFKGDLVVLGAGGYLEEATGAADNNDFDIAGVFWGCHYHEADGSVKYSHMWDGAAGRSNIMGSVIMPAHAVLLIQGTDGEAYTQADWGTRKGVVYAAGNTATGYSGVTLGAAGASVATGPLTVIGLADVPDDMGPWFEVTVNRQSMTASGA